MLCNKIGEQMGLDWFNHDVIKSKLNDNFLEELHFTSNSKKFLWVVKYCIVIKVYNNEYVN